jgi:hypothetical protein
MATEISVNIGTEEEPVYELRKKKGPLVEINCTKETLESNLAIARLEAFEEPKVEQDEFVVSYQPSIQEQLDAQAAAIMELAEVIYGG